MQRGETGPRGVSRRRGWTRRLWFIGAGFAALIAGGTLAVTQGSAAATLPPLVLVGDRDYPPLSYLESGAAAGMDVDVARALSTRLGRDIRVEVMDWDLAQQKVLRGDADGLLSMSISPQRQALFDFTDPTVTHDFGFFMRRGDAALDVPGGLIGKRIGVTRGGFPRRVLENQPSLDLVLIRNYEDGFERLAAGDIDAVAADRWVGASTAERRGLHDIVAIGSPFASRPGAIALRKGQGELVNDLNTAVRSLRSDGTLAQIQEQWRAQEMLFVSRQRVYRLVALAGGASLTIGAALALWVVTVRSQTRARKTGPASVDGRPHPLPPVPSAPIDSIERQQGDGLVRLLASALQSAHDCVSIADMSDRILYVNEAFLRTYEYEERELLGRHISIVRAENDPDTVNGIMEGTRGLGWRGTLWNRSKTGRVFPVSLATSLVHDEFGEIVAAVGVARDMTRELETEDALRRTELKYREVVENANDLIFTVDGQGHCLSMNRAGRLLTGYVAEDGRGIHLTQLVAPHHTDFARKQLERVLGGEDVPTFELDVKSRHGRLLTLELDVHALYEKGFRTGVQGIARDITARRELEGQLRQAQKMEAIGRLAGGIAHDFNNLLTAIVGYSDLVSSELPPGSPLREDLGEIQRAASSAGSLTRQLLIFSRKDVMKPEAVDLNEVVNRIERMLRRIVGENIEFIVRLSRDLGCIEADVGQIEQVVMNLAINARDAMPDGGTLRIETAGVELAEAFVRTHPGSRTGRFVQLTVTDTGHGMTPDVQAQIFTPFFTTKGPSTGTGLGLATVHGIVQQSGGWIEVESAIGQGTRFSIYLPQLTTPPPKRVAAAAPAAGAATGSGTILFVEDDESIRTLSTRMLRHHGFTVLPARHAAEALHLAADTNRRIDLLLTDIVMPGMSGRDLALQLLQSRPDLKVLYTSGYSADIVALRDIQVTGPGFMQKPYSPEALVRQIRAVLAAE